MLILCSTLLLVQFCLSREIERNVTVKSSETFNVVNASASQIEEISHKSPRFDRNFIAEKEKDLTLLISITSGPGAYLRNAARWQFLSLFFVI